MLIPGTVNIALEVATRLRVVGRLTVKYKEPGAPPEISKNIKPTQNIRLIIIKSLKTKENQLFDLWHY